MGCWSRTGDGLEGRFISKGGFFGTVVAHGVPQTREHGLLQSMLPSLNKNGRYCQLSSSKWMVSRKDKKTVALQCLWDHVCFYHSLTQQVFLSICSVPSPVLGSGEEHTKDFFFKPFYFYLI